MSEETVGVTYDNSEIEDLPGVGSVSVEKLSRSGIHNLMDLISRSPREVGQLLDDKEKAAKIVELARQKLQAEVILKGFETADQVLADRQKANVITTGSDALDGLLKTPLHDEGGIETKAMTELYGQFGSGKSQICHQLCVDVQLPISNGGLEGKAVFIDTEGTFRPERLVQMAKAKGLDSKKVLANILYQRIYNSAHQDLVIKMLGEVLKDGKVKLIIVDSAIAHYRAEYLGRESLAERQQKINNMLHRLTVLAEVHNIAVVVTNQVQEKPDAMFSDPTRAAGGNVVAHTSTYRIYLRKGSKNTRVAKMVDSPSHPEAEVVFQLTEDGIRDPVGK